MTEVRDEAGTAERGSLEQLFLAGVGWAALTAEAADEFADELSRRVGADRDRMRDAVRDVISSWRREAEKAGARPAELTDKLLLRFGLVRREEVDDLGLRVAQLEHRIRLLERAPGTESP
jgi:polyhydroxyalkanoate synthesis regulator phasin